MALKIEDVRKMQESLKDAFDAAHRRWDASREDYGKGGQPLRATELATISTALLKADERLREMEHTAKLSGKVPSKG